VIIVKERGNFGLISLDRQKKIPPCQGEGSVCPFWLWLPCSI